MHLKEYFHAEVLGGEHKKFSWVRVLKAYLKSHKNKFFFEYRLAQALQIKYGNIFLVRFLRKRIEKRYPVDIPLECQIGKGFYIAHLVGVVISDKVSIGQRFTIFQNVTIGQKNDQAKIEIGNDVTIGANSCVIGSDMKIGNNCEIGAFSFLCKSIPDNTLVYNISKSNYVYKEEGVEYICSRNTRIRNIDKK